MFIQPRDMCPETKETSDSGSLVVWDPVVWNSGRFFHMGDDWGYPNPIFQLPSGKPEKTGHGLS